MKASALRLAIAVLAALASGAQAQAPAKLPRIGFLGVPSAPAAKHYVEAFRGGLRALGYEEGRNLAVDYRWAEGRYERLQQLAAGFVESKVDVIVAMGTPGPSAAKQATRTIPIVMTNAGDPVGTGSWGASRTRAATSPGSRSSTRTSLASSCSSCGRRCPR